MFFKTILPAFASLFAITVFGLSSSMLPSVLIRASADFNISPENFANIMVVQFAGFILATVLGGIISDRIGKKNILISASLFMFGGTLLWVFAGDLFAANAAGFLTGMGGGILEGMCTALITDLFPLKRKLFLNMSQAAYCVGAVTGPFLIGKLMPGGVSWRLFFWALSIMGIILFLLFVMSRISGVAREDKITYGKLNSLLKNWLFICPCIVIFCYVFSETGIGVFINVYLKKHRDAPENWAIYSISLFWLSMFAGRIICAFIPEHISYRKLIGFIMLIGGMLVGMQFFTCDWVTSLALFSLTGFVFSGTWPLIVGMAAADNPGYSGTVVGLTVATGAFGCLAAPPVINFLFSMFSPELVFALLSVPLIVGAVLLFLTPLVIKLIKKL